VRRFYDTIEQLKPGDMVMVSSNWSAGTIGENRPQLEAVIRHLMRKKVRFTVISFEPQARDISFRFVSRGHRRRRISVWEGLGAFRFLARPRGRYQGDGEGFARNHQAGY
jgi:hypothetical protein